MGMPALGHEFYPNKEQNYRADDRHDEAGRMKRRPGFRFGKQTADHGLAAIALAKSWRSIAQRPVRSDIEAAAVRTLGSR